VRKTVTALAATGLLLVAACSDGSEGSLGDLGQTTTTEPDADTTPSTTPPGDGDGQVPDDDRGNNQACEGQTPVWAYAPMGEPRAELAAHRTPAGPAVPASGTQEPSDGCAQPEPQLGTGDVQITLRWNSSADIDLHVTEPDGTEIWYGDKGPTASGGRLDVDSNVGCEEDGSVENVFWPEGQMPRGEFRVEVTGYSVEGCGSGSYTVVAKVEGQEVLRESGTVGEDESDPYSFET
jgi:hypothetical protein